MTTEQVKAILNEVNIQIDAAADSPTLSVLVRTKFILYLMSTMYLRLTEILSLNLASFESHAMRPGLGKFAVVNIHQKMRGGNRKVIINDAEFPVIIEHYLTQVRPHFSDSSTPDAPLFLTNKGERLSYQQFLAVFRNLANTAGIGEDVSANSFRKACLQHAAMYVPYLSVMQFNADFPSTTAGYIQHKESL